MADSRGRYAMRFRLTNASADPTPEVRAIRAEPAADAVETGHSTSESPDARSGAVTACDPCVPSDGIVHAVRGAVVDVLFARSDLPAVNSALIVEWDRPTDLILEVHSHLDQKTVRAVAFQSTAGLTKQFKRLVGVAPSHYRRAVVA